MDLNKGISSKFGPSSKLNEKNFKTMEESRPNDNYFHSDTIKLSQDSSNFKKKHMADIVRNEFEFISNFFDILDIASLNQGRTNCIVEDDEQYEVANVSEKKIRRKQGIKKGQSSTKIKGFPQTIDGLEKELEEIKGKPMTYQQKLRKKGLQSRLVKKKRKEDIKQQKATAKLQNKHYNYVFNGPNKLVKPVLNSDGNVVSNKFDFADNKTKKENKRKSVTASNEISLETKVFRLDNKGDIKISNSGEGMKINVSSSLISAEKNVSGNLKQENQQNISQTNEATKSTLNEGPVFNKENKMVFSKVFLPENKRKPKKKCVKDPKKILQKIKEQSNKISELEKCDKIKAASLKEKQKWAAALKRASGEKVKDDPELLRKSITKEKNKKVQSQKKWQARMDRVQKEKDERQKKRSENIQARKNEKKKRKFKKAVKKGSFVQV
uniref:Ribosomal RNA-processing protein 14/surfeit locus protein 6 C-terminal domain-containing protein n=2 Tax=Cuerna arida TaxID=1464854 RepID=A0A1B6FKE0_9HEMI